MLDSFPWFRSVFSFSQNTFVLDTNVLLNLYRVQPRTREELLFALKKAKASLWCPNHVAREFMTHRAGVITEYRNWHTEISERLTSAVEKAFEKCATTPYVQTLISMVRAATVSLHSTIKLYADQYGCTIQNDPVLAALTAVFESRIGNPYPPDVLAEKLKEAKRRVACGMPPGLKDAEQKLKTVTTKDDPHAVMIENVYGDVLIWFQIMDFCKKNAISNLTFVTEDMKDGDWISRHEGRYSVGPRVELLEELHTHSNTQLTIMPAARFFAACQEQFDLKMADALNEVSELERIRREAIDSLASTVAKQTNWLRREIHKSMEYLCPITDYNRLYNQRIDDIAAAVETQFLPRILQASRAYASPFL